MNLDEIIMLFIIDDYEDNEYTYSTNWYVKIEDMNDQQYFEYFRMTRNCFFNLEQYINENQSIKN